MDDANLYEFTQTERGSRRQRVRKTIPKLRVFRTSGWRGGRRMTVRHQEIINRIEHMYRDIEGNINFPNSYDGDVLKIAYKSARASLYPQLDVNQQIVLEWLKEDECETNDPLESISDLF